MNTRTITLIHTSPLGPLDIPGIGIVEPGETFRCGESTATALLEQSDLYQLAPKPTPKPKKAAATPSTTKGATE